MTRSGHNTVSIFPRGSDEALSPSEPEFLAVGRVLRPHGLRGEIRVEIHTDYPERFAVHEQLYLAPIADGDEGRTTIPDLSTYVAYELEGHRFHQGTVLLKLVGIDDRNQAEALREQWVWIPIEHAVPLEEGECYMHQVLGLSVVTVDGEDLGRVTQILETGANDVYIIEGAGGEILVPDTEEVVVQVDIEAGRMIVQLIEGLR